MAIRRPARQIEVFDISLMAVVTKAMGAFLVIMILLMPYYRSDPDVGATAAAAQAAMEAMREQLRAMGANPNDPGAMAKAMEAMRSALAAAQRSMSDLAKQGDALASQLHEARRLLEQAQRERDKAEQEAAAAGAVARESMVAGAELEATANRLAEQARGAQAASAEGEQDANRLLQVLQHSALALHWIVLNTWQPEASCGRADIRVLPRRLDDGGSLPPGTDPGTLRDGFLQRSRRVGVSVPPVEAPVGGVNAAGTTGGGPYAPGIGVFGAWDDSVHAIFFAYAASRLSEPCQGSLETVVFDLIRATATRTSNLVTVPVESDPLPVVAVDAGATTRLGRPDAADLAAWKMKLPSLRQELEQARAAAPPAGSP